MFTSEYIQLNILKTGTFCFCFYSTQKPSKLLMCSALSYGSQRQAVKLTFCTNTNSTRVTTNKSFSRATEYSYVLWTGCGPGTKGSKVAADATAANTTGPGSCKLFIVCSLIQIVSYVKIYILTQRNCIRMHTYMDQFIRIRYCN